MVRSTSIKNAPKTRGFYARLTILRLTIISAGSYCCDIEIGCDESVLHSNMAYTALTLLDLIQAIINAVRGEALNRRVSIRITIKYLIKYDIRYK
jgi:hypothetical protein